LAGAGGDDCRVSHRDGVHDRDRWEESDDWFGEPEAAGRSPGDDVCEESWLEEQAAVEGPPRRRLLLNTRTMAVAGGALVGILVLLLWLTGAFGGASHTPSPTTTARPPSTTTVRAPVRAPGRPPTRTLTPGSSGPEVKRLQRALARLGYSSGRVDGSYGPATVKALKQFQQANALQPDGVLGPKTLEVLKAKLRAS
jgi:putative peptidoglycan binding protein